jgi:hypothetical protein
MLLFFKAKRYSTVCIWDILLIHSSVDGHLSCFYLIAIVISDAMNTDVQVFVWVLALNSFGYTSSSEIVGLYGNSMFNSLKIYHTFMRCLCVDKCEEFWYGQHNVLKPKTVQIGIGTD